MRRLALVAGAALAALLVGAPPMARGATDDSYDFYVGVSTPAGAPGDVVSVTITWGNHGPTSHANPVLTYTPPAGASVTGPLPAGWKATPTGARWTAARLAVDPASGGRSAILSLTIAKTVQPGTTLTGGRAVIGVGAAQAHRDARPGNDTAASTVTVLPTRPSPSPTRPPSPSPSPRRTPTPSPPTPSPRSPSPSGSPTPTPTPTPTPAIGTATSVPSPSPSPARAPAPPLPTGSPGVQLAAAPDPPGPSGSPADPTAVAAVVAVFAVAGVAAFLWVRRRLRDPEATEG